MQRQKLDSEAFADGLIQYHNESILKKYQKQLQVGSLDTKAAPPTPPATPPQKKEIVKPEAVSGAIAPQPTQAAAEEAEPFDSYGDLIPYADPSWYQTYHSWVAPDCKLKSSLTNTTLDLTTTRHT